MARIEIGDAATAGVRLALRRPLTVLTWGALVAVYVALLMTLFGGAAISLFQSLIKTPGNQVAPAQIFGLMGSLLGLGLLMWIGLWLINCVIMCAAIRAELEPDHVGFAYLRLGRQEAWMMAVTFVMGVVMYFFQLVVSIPIVVIQNIITFSVLGAAGARDASGGAAMLGPALAFTAFAQLVILGATAWFWLRLCMGPILSFRDREFRLFESWNATRGHVLRMFAAMFLVMLMLSGLYLALYILGGAGVWATIQGAPQLKDPKTFFSRPPSQWMAVFGPMLVFVFFAVVVTAGVANAAIWSAVARMHRQLNPDADIAANFA